MQSAIDQLREEAIKCLKVSGIADPDMVKFWVERADRFTQAADFIESAITERADERNGTGNGTA